MEQTSQFWDKSFKEVADYLDENKQKRLKNRLTKLLQDIEKIETKETKTTTRKRKGMQEEPETPIKRIKKSSDGDCGGDGEGLISYLNDGQWKELLREEFSKPYFQALEQKLAEEKKTYGEDNIFPCDAELFAALNETPFENVKAVIIGQDPYFRKGQAHGLCFSVKKGVKVPASLNRIYLELVDDPKVPNFTKKLSHGYLISWAKQGVLMLNASLSVREGKPNSHAKFGWLDFTDKIIQLVNDRLSGVVFLLWGGFAQKKCGMVDTDKHHVLSCPHPSPMSGNGWKQNRHFSRCNELLEAQGKEPIDW
eukprot:CAMPEP_0174255352 /NCGR_PEP_ID=MMETSP0439-20130205/4695_1 /TAXON_ID=0 /ORGANISM="Stereomyxa ramosa, Strain Chinc5" /LENGTH=308 /DNA_ID=CAMNT_0015337497 /DNA_START=19 /DNA_END=942 /DNA_ORIENTATION=-